MSQNPSGQPATAQVRSAQDGNAGYFKQLTAALRKNILLKMTMLGSTIWETALPIIFIALSILIWYAVGNSTFKSRNFMHSDVPFLNVSEGFSRFVCINRTVSHVEGLNACPPSQFFNETMKAAGFFPTCFEKNDYLLIDDLCTLVHPYVLALEFVNISNARHVPSIDELVVAQMVALALYKGKSQSWYPFQGGDVDVIMDTGLRTLTHPGVLYISPNNSVTHDLVDYMNATSLLFRHVFGGFFATEADAMFNSTRYDRKDPHIWGIVNVNALTPSDFDVTLRLNRSALAWTDAFVDSIYNGGLEHDMGITYFSSGFLTLQKTISEFYIQRILNMSLPSPEPVISPMPFPEYTSWDFLVVGAREGYFSLGIVLAYLYTVSQITKNIVIEKETRVREAMKIMGLGNGAFYTSWFLTYAIEVFIASLISSLITKVSYFPRIEFFALFFLIFLFGLSSVSLAALASSFFAKARIAALVTPVLYFLLSIPMFLVNNMPVTGRSILLLLSPSAMTTFSQSMSREAGCQARTSHPTAMISIS